MDWKQDERIKNIDPEKLNLLTALSQNIHGNSPSEVMPLLMAAMTQANSKGLSFSEEETDLIIQILTEKMSTADKQKVNQIRAMVKRMHPQKKK